jgi:methionyl-tRNA formyltransferase
MRIVFMGSAEFGIPTLDMLDGGGHRIVGVVSTPPRPRGRGRVAADSPVTVHARAKGIEPVLLPESLNDQTFILALRELKADVFVVVAFRLLPEAVFTIPRFGTLNVHASLLPRYRGPAPIQRAIEAGER